MAKKIIFIIEDDPDISELMQIIVENEGYSVKIFRESDKIIENVKKHKPALILMDLWLSGFDNTALVKNLKTKKLTAQTPIVLISAKTFLEKIAERSGADGFLAKPFNIADLVKIVKKFA